MSKHTHRKSKEEQIDNKAHGMPSFHYDPYQTSEVVKLEDIRQRLPIMIVL